MLYHFILQYITLYYIISYHIISYHIFQSASRRDLVHINLCRYRLRAQEFHHLAIAQQLLHRGLGDRALRADAQALHGLDSNT